MQQSDRDSYVTCKELEDEINQTGQSSKFFKLSGFVKVIFNEDKLFYMACPDCKKKVTLENSLWRCENCLKSHKNSQPTYMLSAVIHDATGDVLVQFPREFGDPIMNGKSA